MVDQKRDFSQRYIRGRGSATPFFDEGAHLGPATKIFFGNDGAAISDEHRPRRKEAVDDAFDRAFDEEELDLMAEEYELPLGRGAVFGTAGWIDDLVEESNRYFKRQYEEAAARAAPCGSEDRAPMRIKVPSLFELSAAAAAPHFVPELRWCLPDDVLEAVQRRMPKERQIACFGHYKRWEPREPLAGVSLQPGHACGSRRSEGTDASDADVVQQEREAWTLVKSCPYDGFGRKHGLAREWRRDGSLWCTTMFEFGVRSGVHVEYFADGRKALEAHYRDGRLHGTLKWWYDAATDAMDAATLVRGQRPAGVQAFVNGRKEGSGHVWREDGSLWRTKHYRDDRKHGIWRTFDQVGNVSKCSRYDSDGRKRKAGAAQLTTSCPLVLALPSKTDATMEASS